MNVLAYHITWGTYGTRLHGDPRGTVDRANNEHGEPIVGRDAERQKREKDFMKYPPICLTREQCIYGQDTIPGICERGHWTLHTCACAPDHVHVVLTSPFDPKTIRALLKRWLGQSLREKWEIPEDQTWWAEDGSIKWISNESYFGNAVDYVRRQRMT